MPGPGPRPEPSPPPADPDDGAALAPRQEPIRLGVQTLREMLQDVQFAG